MEDALRREGHEDEDWERLALQDPKCFPYKTILFAANYLRPENKICGVPFYKGKLRKGGEIAVKKLGKRSDEGMRELVRDLKLLTKLKHPNVLNLGGYAVARDSAPLLAYDDVPTTTLRSYLIPNRRLCWRLRYEIIQGVAKGLKYLHGGSQNGIIIHSEINPTNILLARNWRPIIALFRAQQLDTDETHVYEVVETRYRDVPPYIAPEYWKDGYLSEKVDIYSFGFLMLSLISSDKYETYNLPSQLIDSVHKLYEENRILEFMDPSLANSAVVEQVINCIIIGLICVQGNPKARPDMDCVVSMLAGKESIMGMHIGKPGLSGYNKSDLNDFDVSSQQPQPLLHVYQASHEATQNQGNEIEVVDGHKNQDSPLNSNQIMKEEADCHASGGAIQKEGEEFEEFYFDEDNPDDILVNEHQIQDNPSNSNQIMREGHDLQMEHDEEYLRQIIASHKCIEFSYDALVDATENFRNELGHGGFGVVYSGNYGEQDIAVKKPFDMSHRQRKIFLNEVRLLCSLKHRNVVRLVGYCIDRNQHLLVFEYIVNGSLEELLSDPIWREQKLDWSKRYGIIKGIAAALSYLHDNLPNSIVHRDIKLANILLDDQFQPKIADFGISRSLDVDQTHVTATRIISWGYAAPEYCQFGYLSTLSDVYSFGVVLLEIVSGERYYFKPSPPHVEAEGLLDWAYKLFERGKTLDMMDPTLTNPEIHAQVKNCIQVALLCVQGDREKRPSMQKVLSMLTLNKVTQKIICRPGFYAGFEDNNIFRAIKRWFIQ